MVKYLLDTNICIAYLTGVDISLKHRVNSLQPQGLALCSIVKAELFFGARNSGYVQKNLKNYTTFVSRFESYPFDDACVEIFGVLKAKLRLSGTPVGSNDLLIASIALTHNLTLITRNHREFSHVHDLKIEEW